MNGDKKKILLVDDDPLIRKLTKTTLAEEEFKILEAETGEQALKITEEEKPDLILLDIKLPGKDGFQVCRQIKQDDRIRSTYVIILTGEPTEDMREKGKKAGADDYFTKPFSPIELIQKVHKVFGDQILEIEEEESGDEIDEELLSTQEIEKRFRTPQEIRQFKEEQLLMYALDLSKLHRKELKKTRELKKAYQKLKEIEKMKDVFIALVSHELRTPLSIIKGYSYLLQEVLNKSSLEQDVSGFMKPITKATDRLENLIGELLDFSHMKSGLLTFQKKEINLPNILNLIIKEYKSQFDSKQIKIITDIQEDIRPIKADYERLKEAFAHFVKNALNFTKPGGTFKITYRDEGIWVEVKFIDTGRGISQEEIEKIFNPFYQSANFLTREVGGMGLGLSIAKHIIEDHGGNIQVESKVNEGTTFTVKIPRSYQDAKEIVAELKQTYPRKIEQLSKDLKATQEQLLAYAQELSSVYAREKQRTEQLEETLNALERTYIQTIAALSRSIDIKDAYYSGHTDRVSFYAQCIARRLNPELLHDRNFKYSLLLHDIGKIGVAEEILKKVDKLTDEEWHIVRGHPAKAVEILKDVEFLSPALNTVRSHHERWDGKGYPDGLKGEEIPLPARIISVADSFDAMTTDRPYRQGISLEEAREEIKRQSGFQFDPEVVNCFLDVWEEIKEFAAKAKKTEMKSSGVS